jgi:hypothetical protein
MSKPIEPTLVVPKKKTIPNPAVFEPTMVIKRKPVKSPKKQAEVFADPTQILPPRNKIVEPTQKLPAR